MPREQETTTVEAQPIDQTGTILSAETYGDVLVSLNIEATASTDFAIDVSADGDTWFENEETYTGSSIADTFVVGDRHLRVRVTAAAANGETADVTLQEARS